MVLSGYLQGQNQKKYRVEPLNMKECILRALKYNLELEIESYNPKIKEFDLNMARSEFDPAFTTSLTIGELESERAIGASDSSGQPTTLFLQTATRIIQTKIGVGKRNSWGGTMGIYYGIDYSKQLEKKLSSRNPSWESSFTFQISQPLLRNLGISVNLASIHIAQNEVNRSVYGFKNKIIQVLSRVQLAYWNLVNAIANYDLQKKSLEQAENLYKITMARIKAGSLAAADILEAETNVASKQDSLILAEKMIYDAEDVLKQLINPTDLNYYKHVRLMPTERYDFKKFQVDFEKTLHEALKLRPDLRAAKIGLKTAGISVEKNKNQLLPKLDLSAELGLGGFGESLNKSWDQVKDTDFFSWTVQLNLEIPLGNRLARNQYLKSLAQKKQALAQYKLLESSVLTQVREAVRALLTAMRRTETAQKTRKLAERQLANEENKFRAGIIALFQVQTTEQKLTAARINESNALLGYQRALVQLGQAKGAILEEIKRYGVDLKLPEVQKKQY